MKLLPIILFCATSCFGQLVSGTIANGSWGSGSAAPAAAWSPTNSVFLKAWYEADDLDAGYDEGNNINSWANKASTGSGSDLVVWTTRYPVFSADYYNGHDAVHFEGADGLTNHIVSIAQPWTMLLALRFAAVPSGAQMLLSGTNGTGAQFQAGSGYVRAQAGTNLSAGAAMTNWTVWTVTATGGQGVLYSNNVSVASGDIGMNPIDGLAVGLLNNGTFFNGYIGSLSLYGTNLSTSDRNSAFSYVTNLYPVQ